MIRPAGPDDAAACCRLVQAGFETFRAFAPAGWEPPDETTSDRVEHAATQLARPDAFAVVAHEALALRPRRTAAPTTSGMERRGRPRGPPRSA